MSSSPVSGVGRRDVGHGGMAAMLAHHARRCRVRSRIAAVSVALSGTLGIGPVAAQSSIPEPDVIVVGRIRGELANVTVSLEGPEGTPGRACIVGCVPDIVSADSDGTYAMRVPMVATTGTLLATAQGGFATTSMPLRFVVTASGRGARAQGVVTFGERGTIYRLDIDYSSPSGTLPMLTAVPVGEGTPQEPTITPTSDLSPAPTVTPTWTSGTPTASPSATGTATPTGTPTNITPPPVTCVGDCDGDGLVKVDEVVAAVAKALNPTAPRECDAVDRNGNGVVTVDELVTAVDRLLRGCAEGD